MRKSSRGKAGVAGVAGVRSQEHPTGKAREDLRSNWRSADLAVAEKSVNSNRPLSESSSRSQRKRMNQSTDQKPSYSVTPATPDSCLLSPVSCLSDCYGNVAGFILFSSGGP